MGVLTFAALSYVLRSIYQRLDRLGIFDVNEDVACRPTAWVEGLRGISALGVLSSHLSTCLAQFMFEACCSPGTSSPSIFQLPPLRALAAGHSWLAMFFLLSGFVSAIRPLQLSRSGRLEAAYMNLGRASFKRPLRFILPASVATIFSWFLCQLGGYIVARKMGVFLLSTEAKLPESSWWCAFKELLRALTDTWRWLGSNNEFEKMQYALSYMLQGSYLTYGILLGTLGIRTEARVAITCLTMYLSFGWSWHLVDPQVGFAYLSGLLLAEFWFSEWRQKAEEYWNVLSPLSASIGTIFVAWPKNKAEATTWASFIRALLDKTCPPARDIERIAGTLGAILLVLAIMVSPRLRLSMASPFMLWLGKISFAVYLVHMMVLRLFMPWLLYIDNPLKGLYLLRDLDSEQFKANVRPPGLIRGILGIAWLVILVMASAHLWTRLVEPKVERIGTLIEDFATGTRSSRPRGNTPVWGENGTLPEYKSKPS